LIDVRNVIWSDVFALERRTSNDRRGKWVFVKLQSLKGRRQEKPGNILKQVLSIGWLDFDL